MMSIVNAIKEYFPKNCNELSDQERKNICIALGIGVSYAAFRLIHSQVQTYKRNRKINKKRRYCDDRKLRLSQKLDGMVTPLKNIAPICSLSGAEIMAQFKSGKLDCISVLEAFQAKAILVDDKLNCVTEVVYEADVDALMIDSSKSQKEQLLRGLPVSIKDSLSIKGYDCAMGMHTRLFDPASKDCTVVAVLRSHGAIPFVITTVPHMLMALESNNPVQGVVKNPCCPDRSPGGSSGGEGALLGAGGSPLGFGTDCAGSIRMPSAFCGVVGFKPTSQRLSTQGVLAGYPEMNFLPVSIGPIAKDVDTVILGVRALLSDSMYNEDILIPRMPFDMSLLEDDRPLRVGYFTTLPSDNIKATSGVQRAVLQAKRALEMRGHSVHFWQHPRPFEASLLISRCLFADNLVGLVRAVDVEKHVDPVLQESYRLAKVPRIFIRMASFLIRPFVPNIYAQVLSIIAEKKEAFNVTKLTNDIKSYKYEFSKAWQQSDLDALICPPFPSCAFHRGTGNQMGIGIVYSALFNILDMPAGVVPITKVNDDDVSQVLKEYPCDIVHKPFAMAAGPGSQGLPLATQVVSMRWKDELCLRVMKEIELGLQIIEKL